MPTASLRRRRFKRRLPARQITERPSIPAEEGEKYKAEFDHMTDSGLEGTQALARRVSNRAEPHLGRPDPRTSSGRNCRAPNARDMCRWVQLSEQGSNSILIGRLKTGRTGRIRFLRPLMGRAGPGRVGHTFCSTRESIFFGDPNLSAELETIP